MPATATRSHIAAADSSWQHVAFGLALLGLVAVTLLFRWPFLHVPLTQDEGGYAYIAREWDSGARLYSAAWVDRPQGLMLLFRLVIHVAPSIGAMRLFGAFYSAASTIFLAVVGARLYGAAAGLCAGLLYAVFATGPHIEGFIVDGELLSTLPTVAAVACLLLAQRSRRAWLYLLLAGVCAGMAPLVKQSSIDGIVTVVLFAPLRRDVHVRERLGRLAVVLCGVAIPLLLSVLHGALTGWQDYINAVLLDALRYRAAEAGKIPLHRAITGIQDFWSDAAFLLVAAGFGLVSLLRRGGGGLRLLPVAWLAGALYALTLGGFYFRHYFVQLLPPLCLLAALGLVAVVRWSSRRPWAALLLLLPLAGLLNALRLDAPFYINSSPLGISARLYGWAEYAHQHELVAFLRARVPAGQPFFVAYAAPELHYLTGRPSITPYLWRRPLGELPGGYADAVRAVARGVPVCIVVVQPLATAPGDRRMRAAIGTRYVKAWSPRGIAILCRPS